MIEVDGLWVWGTPDHGQIKLGNREAARAFSISNQESGVVPASPEIKLPNGQARQALGVYQLPGGLPVSIEAPVDQSTEDWVKLLVPLRSDNEPTDYLQFDYLFDDNSTPAESRDCALWKNGEVLASYMPSVDGHEATRFHVLPEILIQMAKPNDAMALLHGSAVLWRGQRIILAGESGTGKSTLAALMVADGGEYLADDIIVLTSDGKLIPTSFYPSIKEGSWDILYGLFPSLKNSQTYFKGSIRYKFLKDAIFSTEIECPDYLIFPKYTMDLEPRIVGLTKIESLLYLAKAGSWVEPNHIKNLVSFLDRAKCLGLRHNSNLNTILQLILDG